MPQTVVIAHKTANESPGIVETMTSAPSFTPVSIALAGRTIPDAADMVIRYLNGVAGQRILDFDYEAKVRRDAFAAGTQRTRITRNTIVSAQNLMAQFHRTLKMSEQAAITRAFEFFAAAEATAPWHLITPAHTFLEADPVVCGDKYDDLCEIWFHFRDLSPRGIGAVQINKVLHQVMPDLVVVYDSVLRGLYKGRTVGREVANARRRLDAANKWTKRDDFGWEPMRRDMRTISAEDFVEIRRQVATRPCWNSCVIEEKSAQKWAAENLSDVRLIDMIAWQL